MGAGVGHLAGQEVLDEAESQVGGQGVVFLDGGAAGQLGVEVTAEGVQVHAALLLQADHQVIQQGLRVPFRQEVR